MKMNSEINNIIEVLKTLKDYSKSVLEKSRQSLRESESESSWNVGFALIAFEVCIQKIEATLRILEHPSENSSVVINIFDICSTGRILIDGYINLKYLLNNQSEDEKQLKKLAFEQYIANNTICFYEKHKKSDNDLVNSLKHEKESRKDEIQCNPLWRELEKSKNVLEGLEKRIYSDNRIVEGDGFWLAHNFFSDYVHLYPYALNQYVTLRSQIESAEILVNPMLVDLCLLLCICIDELAILDKTKTLNLPKELVDEAKQKFFKH